jgi:ParB family transcriptional regulator, chromosome partitioning protein
MTKVARTVPLEVIRFVGAAHGVGRRRWEDLADRLRDQAIDIDALIAALPAQSKAAESDDRFGLVADLALRATRQEPAQSAAPPALSVRHSDGSKIAEIKDTPRAVTIRVAASEQPEFTRWMREHAEAEILRLFEAWKSAN